MVVCGNLPYIYRMSKTVKTTKPIKRPGRVDLDLPTDSGFIKRLDAAAKAANRSRKNYIENLVIEAVNNQPVLIDKNKK